jgi:hypothetical protein
LPLSKGADLAVAFEAMTLSFPPRIVRELLHCGALFVLNVILSAESAAADARRPNILFIYSDDQSFKTLGCYPESFPGVKTPNIDALARSGVRFHGAYLGSWCMPSRATMLTGRLPHGVESMTMEGAYPGSTYDPKQTPFFPA